METNVALFKNITKPSDKKDARQQLSRFTGRWLWVHVWKSTPQGSSRSLRIQCHSANKYRKAHFYRTPNGAFTAAIVQLPSRFPSVRCIIAVAFFPWSCCNVLITCIIGGSPWRMTLSSARRKIVRLLSSSFLNCNEYKNNIYYYLLLY